MMGSVGLFIVRCFHNGVCGSCFHCYVGLVVFTVSLVFTVMWGLFSQWVLFSLLCGACCFHSGSCFHCFMGLVVFTMDSLGLVITVCSIGLHLMCANCILLALSTNF